MKRLFIIVFSLLDTRLVRTKPFVDNSLKKFGNNDDIRANIELPYTQTWKWSSLGSGVESDDESASFANAHRLRPDDVLHLVNVTADSVYLLHKLDSSGNVDDDALWTYKLHHSSDHNALPMPSIKRAFDVQRKTITFAVTKLRPNTNHHFQLLKTNGSEMAAVGDRLSVTTKSCGPFRPPRTHSSAFRQITLSSETPGVADRWVRVYWVAVPIDERNGNGLGYRVKIFEQDNYVDEVRCDASQTHIDRTLSRKRHTFAISSLNYYGESPEESIVEVPAAEDVLKLNASRIDANFAHVSFDKCEIFAFHCTAVSTVNDRPICEDISQMAQVEGINRNLNDLLSLVDGSDWNVSVDCFRNKTSSGLI